jgi:hypothetical protein
MTDWKSIYDSSVKLKEGEMYVVKTRGEVYCLTIFKSGKFVGRSKVFEIGEPTHFCHIEEAPENF